MARLNGSRVRILSLAVIAAGAYVLRPGDVAAASRTERFETCSEFAHAFAAGFCAAYDKQWQSVAYQCNPDGTITILQVSCMG